MVTIYGIRNCDTMKKAFAWMDSRGIAYTFVDYKKSGVVESCLPRWLAAAGWQALLNTRGLMWKKLSDADRADIDAAKAARLMATTPSLIRRPVIEVGKTVLIGFDPKRYEESLQ